MQHIKLELNRLLGQIESLDDSSPESSDQLYSLLKRAYNIISDSFDLDQCHSVLHHLRSQFRELDRLRTSSSPSQDAEKISDKSQAGQLEDENSIYNKKNYLSELKESTENELRIFISHL